MFTVDTSSATPPFEQLRAQVVAAIAAGRLVAGARLPPVRRLADDIGVAPGTVARAYRELEASGITQTRGRAGSFVSLDENPLRREAQQAAAAFAQRVRALGLGAEDVLSIVASALRADS